jgi:Mitochondrial carrier protein
MLTAPTPLHALGQPFDVVKTRAQSEILVSITPRAPEIAACGCDHSGQVAYKSPTASGTAGGRSVWSALQTIYEVEGINGLWRGNTARMIKVAPSCAIMIMCYEFGKNVLTHTDY